MSDELDERRGSAARRRQQRPTSRSRCERLPPSLSSPRPIRPRSPRRAAGSRGRASRASRRRARRQHAPRRARASRTGYGVIEGAPTARAALGRHRRRAASTARSRGGCSTARSTRSRRRASPARSRDVMPVPGAFELPLAAMALAKTRRYACIVALGCVIRGETPHFDFVAERGGERAPARGARDRRPGRVRRPHDRHARAGARRGSSKGAEAARTALEMADVFAQLRAPRSCGRAPHVACGATLRAPCPRSAQSAGRSPASGTTGATRWSRRSGASTRTSSASASCSTARRSARTSARAASRPARSRRRSDARVCSPRFFLSRLS